jgi:bifunctional NMN adenylyltransferase/nudix hydrolase
VPTNSIKAIIHKEEFLMKKYHTAVVIGRFQIVHHGHEKLMEKAASIADNIVVLVGSVGQPKTPKNPFSFVEREKMLEAIMPSSISHKILPVRDQRYNNNNWVADVVNKVNSTLPTGWSDYPPKIVLVGHKKDTTSSYLNMFPQWQFEEVYNHASLDATILRNSLFKYPSTGLLDIPESTKNFIEEWRWTDEFRHIQSEHNFYVKYKEPYEKLPYPPIFVTVDALVIQSGHILMIKRKEFPGKGLWALPGGFLNATETLREAVLRELTEETQIKLQKIILDRSITRVKEYDHPERSQRGRTITHAFKFELKPGDLPRIKGSSDAEKAKWIPLNEVFTMGEEIYEDHLDIILDMVH